MAQAAAWPGDRQGRRGPGWSLSTTRRLPDVHPVVPFNKQIPFYSWAEALDRTRRNPSVDVWSRSKSRRSSPEQWSGPASFQAGRRQSPAGGRDNVSQDQSNYGGCSRQASSTRSASRSVSASSRGALGWPSCSAPRSASRSQSRSVPVARSRSPAQDPERGCVPAPKAAAQCGPRMRTPSPKAAATTHRARSASPKPTASSNRPKPFQVERVHRPRQPRVPRFSEFFPEEADDAPEEKVRVEEDTEDTTTLTNGSSTSTSTDFSDAAASQEACETLSIPSTPLRPLQVVRRAEANDALSTGSTPPRPLQTPEAPQAQHQADGSPSSSPGSSPFPRPRLSGSASFPPGGGARRPSCSASFPAGGIGRRPSVPLSQACAHDAGQDSSIDFSDTENVMQELARSFPALPVPVAMDRPQTDEFLSGMQRSHEPHPSPCDLLAQSDVNLNRHGCPSLPEHRKDERRSTAVPVLVEAQSPGSDLMSSTCSQVHEAIYVGQVPCGSCDESLHLPVVDLHKTVQAQPQQGFGGPLDKAQLVDRPCVRTSMPPRQAESGTTIVQGPAAPNTPTSSPTAQSPKAGTTLRASASSRVTNGSQRKGFAEARPMGNDGTRASSRSHSGGSPGRPTPSRRAAVPPRPIPCGTASGLLQTQKPRRRTSPSPSAGRDSPANHARYHSGRLECSGSIIIDSLCSDTSMSTVASELVATPVARRSARSATPSPTRRSYTPDRAARPQPRWRGGGREQLGANTGPPHQRREASSSRGPPQRKLVEWIVWQEAMDLPPAGTQRGNCGG